MIRNEIPKFRNLAQISFKPYIFDNIIKQKGYELLK